MFRPDMRIMTGGEMRAGPLVLVPSGCMMQEWSKTLLDNQNDRKDPLHHSNIFSLLRLKCLMNRFFSQVIVRRKDKCLNTCDSQCEALVGAGAKGNKDWKLKMGFLRKYVAISLVGLLLLLSAFLSLHTMTDLLAETKGSNASTKRILEELTVSEDNKVVYVKQVQFWTWYGTCLLQDNLLPSEVISNDSVTLLPGWVLYR